MSSAKAQVVPFNDATGTTVTQQGNTINIDGGTQSGGNLFHKFDELSIEPAETANFTSNSSVFNIVGQVAGGSPSYIEGQVQVSGSDANLYLVNPAGILFGPDAQISLSGSFTATTADQVGFDDAWLNVLESSADYSALKADPSAMRFTADASGAVVNQADLVVAENESLSLVGGNVLSEGRLEAPGGEIGLVAVTGKSTVRLARPGSLLSLEVTGDNALSNSIGTAFTPTDLPVLLTGESGVGTDTATRLTISDGLVSLISVGVEAEELAVTGEISTRSLTGDGGTITLLGHSTDVVSATIDASGTRGGTVVIGRNTGLSSEAELVFLSGSTIRADGQSGQGGTISLEASNRTTLESGILSAQGASQGGTITTSADFLTLADVSVSAEGALNPGQWLLNAVGMDIVRGATDVNEVDPASIAAALDANTNVMITTGGAGMGDIALLSDIDQTGASEASLSLLSRRFTTNGSDIDLASTGQLTFGINQLNVEANPTSDSITNAIAAIGDVKGDRLIDLGAGNYTFSAETAIDTDVAITGSANDGTILTAVSNNRIFDVLSPATVSLRDLTFTKTDTATGSVAGGLENAGNLTIENSLFQDNQSEFGGAINTTTDSTLTVLNSEFENNVATSEGGAISAAGSTVSISGTTFTNNSSSRGGGINALQDAAITITDSEFKNNTADSQGGAITSHDATLNISATTFANNLAERGGAIHATENSILALTSSDLLNNVAGREGGGLSIVNSNAFIADTILSGNTAVRFGGGLHSTSGSQVSVLDSTFQSNVSDEDGGGLSSLNGSALSITNSELLDNEAVDDGGGLHLISSGGATLSNVTVEGNIAGDLGGGLYQFNSADLSISDSVVLNNAAGNRGGGLANNSSSGFTEVTNTDFDQNVANEGGALFSLADSLVSITGGTFRDNKATSGMGGALLLTSSANGLVADATFEDNQADGEGGAIVHISSGTFTVSASDFNNNRSTNSSGGAVQVLSTSNASIATSTFTGNTALDDGGALHSENTNISVLETTFASNAATGDGGAVAIAQSGSATFDGTTFTNNSATSGGALLTWGDVSVSLNDSLFTQNAASAQGGGIFLTDDSAVTIANNSLLERNVANAGGGIAATADTNLTIRASQLARNEAVTQGGGIFQNSGVLSVITTGIRDNTAGADGGGLSLIGDVSSFVSSSVVSENISAQQGGGIFYESVEDLFITDSGLGLNEAGAEGGAIAHNASGTLTLLNSPVEGNKAREGGGLFASDSTTTIIEGFRNFSDNEAVGDGGGISLNGSGASLTVQDAQFLRNTAGGNGGGIHNVDGTFRVTNATFSENTSVGSGGGIFSQSNNAVSVSASNVTQNTADVLGGGIFNNSIDGVFNISESTFNGNVATRQGGAIAGAESSQTVILDSTLSGNQSQFGGGISGLQLADITLLSSQVHNNAAVTDGGGIRLGSTANITIEESQIFNNTASFGGGLDLSISSTATVTDTEFVANQATRFGGGITVDSRSTLTLANSTLAGNQVGTVSGPAGAGGGIFSGGLTELTNTTISGNTAVQDGGGISLLSADAVLKIHSSTITDNTAGTVGGGISFRDSLPTAELLNTIVAGNTAGSDVVSADVVGQFIDSGSNLIGIADATAGFTNASFVGSVTNPLDPNLNALADNGGLTQTHLLQSDSLALNAGLSSLFLPATDQRGQPRIVGAAVDIGALELTASELPPEMVDVIAPNSPTDPDPSISTVPSMDNPNEVPVVPTDISLLEPTNEPSHAETDDVEDAVNSVLSNIRRNEQSTNNKAVRRLEQTFGQSFDDYWDLSLGPELSFDEVQAILRRAQEEYQVNSAVIYAAFLPEDATSEDTAEGDNSDEVQILQLESETSGNDLLNLSLVMPEGDLISYQLPFTRKQVTRQVRLFRSTVSDPVDDIGYKPLSQQVYEWLLAPLETELASQGIQNLMYSLDTGLRTAPITAMRDENGFALERFGMSVIPNVGLMQADFGEPVRRTTVAMGVAEFESQEPLPAVPIELAMVNDFVPASQTVLNEGTTLDALQAVKALEQPGVLHLATHADFDAYSPESSSIQLWEESLSMEEFRKLDWSSSDLELLVLSACLTAMSSPNAGLGFAGLAAASGVDATVGSLWLVSDVGTLALMSEFYAQLEATDLRFDALRRAQLALMNGDTRIENGNLITSRGEVDLPDDWNIPADATLDHPFFWSAFTMVGNPW
ncbi:MAG: CHAT domain-containing protein [Phormidesmis sp.]